MGEIFKSILTGIQYLFSKKVYCQDSAKDITMEGGYYTSYGGIYRQDIDMSIFQSVSMKDKKFFVEPKNPKEVQQLIKEGKLTHFGYPSKLEVVLNDD